MNAKPEQATAHDADGLAMQLTGEKQRRARAIAAAMRNQEKQIRELEAETKALVDALEFAKDTIKQWHNGDEFHRFLTDADKVRMWELYQQSPEMKRINTLLSAIKAQAQS